MPMIMHIPKYAVKWYNQPVKIFHDWPGLHRTLDEFWEQAGHAKSVAERLVLLQDFATRRVKRKRSYQTIRTGKGRSKLGRICWCCLLRNARVRHHIVQVQLGGANGDRCEVSLCQLCHAAIHPWLKKR
jgi:hypothetical protein